MGYRDEIEDGMGFSGLVPTAKEKLYEKRRKEELRSEYNKAIDDAKAVCQKEYDRCERLFEEKKDTADLAFLDSLDAMGSACITILGELEQLKEKK